LQPLSRRKGDLSVGLHVNSSLSSGDKEDESRTYQRNQKDFKQKTLCVPIKGVLKYIKPNIFIENWILCVKGHSIQKPQDHRPLIFCPEGQSKSND